MVSASDARASAGLNIGAWCNLPSPEVAELAARCGFDFVCIDFQHGYASERDAAAMFRAVDAGGSTPIARAGCNDPYHLGRLLDFGAAGVIVPMIESVDDVRRAVEACFYPPAGRRSYGPTRARGFEPGAAYLEKSNAAARIYPMIETEAALEAVEDIAAVEGVSGLFVGPSDLSIALGIGPGQDHAAPRFTDALARVVRACRSAGVVAGIQASPSIAKTRASQGFTLMTIAMDNTDLERTWRTEFAKAHESIDLAALRR